MYKTLPAIEKQLNTDAAELKGDQSRLDSTTQCILNRVRNLRENGFEHAGEKVQSQIQNIVDKQKVSGMMSLPPLLSQEGEFISKNYQKELDLCKEEIERLDSSLSYSVDDSSDEEVVIGHEKFTYQEEVPSRTGGQRRTVIKGLQLCDGEKVVVGKFAPAPPTRFKQDHWKLNLNESGYDSIFTSFARGPSGEIAKTQQADGHMNGENTSEKFKIEHINGTEEEVLPTVSAKQKLGDVRDGGVEMESGLSGSKINSAEP